MPPSQAQVDHALADLAQQQAKVNQLKLSTNQSDEFKLRVCVELVLLKRLKLAHASLKLEWDLENAQANEYNFPSTTKAAAPRPSSFDKYKQKITQAFKGKPNRLAVAGLAG
ncbi:hypothetical protein BASA81_003182 [Batrachochytrium salamandrivorans]|nr:hypothetical protein BASA81_003182 [Batrachochytrium salamandrivorans]